MIDWLQAQDHLLLSGILPDEPVVLALFPKVTGACIHVHTTAELPEDARQAVEAQITHNPDLSLGFVLNPGGTKNEEIKWCRGLVYEDDGAATLDEKLAQWQICGLPRPSLQTWTGGKSVHNYWFLREGCTPAAFRAAQRLLFKHVEGCLTGVKIDESLSKPCQVLRLAGGVHPLTGEVSRVMTTSGELFELQQLTALIRPIELTVAAKEAAPLAHAKSGTHYERMTATQKQDVVVEALRFCPEREAPGTSTYEAARDVLSAMVHEFGVDTTAALARRANWSQAHWNLTSVANSLVDAPEHRKQIWSLFTTAQEKGWVCPWPLEREVRSKNFGENEDDELLKELRQRSYWQWAEARAAGFKLSSVFPEELAQILVSRADAFPVSETAMMAPFMTTLSSVIGKRLWVEVATGWKEPCIFWMGTVAPAGSKKTPVANQFLWPLEKRDGEDRTLYKAKLKEWKAGDGMSPPPELPRQRVVMDATLEALCQLLDRDGVPGVVSFHDELANFIASMDAYRGRGANKDRSAWLSMWSGGGINILRKGSEPILIEKTSVSLFGAIQQDKLTEMLHGDNAVAKSGDGFWARFLWVVPPYVKPVVRRDGIEINQELMGLVSLLDDLPKEPTVIGLSDGAWEVFEETANRFTEIAERTYAARCAFLMKLHGYLARSAGLLWALDHVCKGNSMRTIGDIGPISRECMERAAVLCQFFLNQFDVLAPQVGGGDLPGWVVSVVEKAKTHPEHRVTARDLVRSKVAESGKEAKAMLEKLVSEYGLGRILKSPRADQTWWELPGG